MKEAIMQNPEESLKAVEGLCKGDFIVGKSFERILAYMRAAKETLANPSVLSEEIQLTCYAIIFTVARYVLLNANKTLIPLARIKAIKEELKDLVNYTSKQAYYVGLAIMAKSVSQQIDAYFDRVYANISKQTGSGFINSIAKIFIKSPAEQIKQLQKQFYQASSDDRRNQIVEEFINNYQIPGAPAVRNLVKEYNEYCNLLKISLYHESQAVKAAVNGKVINNDKFDELAAKMEGISSVAPANNSENNGDALKKEVVLMVESQVRSNSLKRRVSEVDNGDVPPAKMPHVVEQPVAQARPVSREQLVPASELTSHGGPLASKKIRTQVGDKIKEARESLAMAGLQDPTFPIQQRQLPVPRRS